MKANRTVVSALALSMLASTGVVFAQGYNGPPPPAFQQGGPGGWDTAPPEFREAEQHGFHDGIEGARKDFENHRAPNVRNRDEFRHPSVAGPDRREYKLGFRRGYDVAVRHMYGPGPR